MLALRVLRSLATPLLPDHAELSPRPDWVPAWDALTDEERRVYARYMEAFAAFLDHTDTQIGRLIDALEENDDVQEVYANFDIPERVLEEVAS